MTKRTIRDLLGDHPFFADLDPEYLDLIAGCGQNVVFAADTPIAREGEPADFFYVLREGRVALDVHEPARGPIVVATLSPGDVLGWSWLFAPYRWRFDVRALEPVRAVALDGVCLRGKCDADPRLGYDLVHRFAGIMVARLESTRLQLLNVYGWPA
ncbi:MAG: cyclic nucleotide-binding domain-containing protein [Acidimicrobiia bacterium]|nr:cyclic nucleotide-binding domain-containing protein [Acidimicrobiia bacterium]